MGGVSVAGLRPGLGRGGITHSLEVMEPGVPGPGEGATDGRATNAGPMASGGGAAMAVAGVMDTPVVAIMMPESLQELGWESAGT